MVAHCSNPDSKPCISTDEERQNAPLFLQYDNFFKSFSIVKVSIDLGAGLNNNIIMRWARMVL